jgi:hypothetical protein
MTVAITAGAGSMMLAIGNWSARDIKERRLEPVAWTELRTLPTFCNDRSPDALA